MVVKYGESPPPIGKAGDVDIDAGLSAGCFRPDAGREFVNFGTQLAGFAIAMSFWDTETML